MDETKHRTHIFMEPKPGKTSPEVAERVLYWAARLRSRSAELANSSSIDAPKQETQEKDIIIIDGVDILDSLQDSHINEASLNRLIAHTQKQEPLAFLSVSRVGLSKEENNENYQELQGVMRRAQFGFNKIIGGYAEETGEEVIENSIVIFASADRENELKDLAIALGKKYKQDAIMFAYSKGNVVYIGTMADSSVGGIGKEIDVDDGIDTHSIEKFYAKIGNKKFVLKSISEDVEAMYGSYNVRVINEMWKSYVEKYGVDALEEWDKSLR